MIPTDVGDHRSCRLCSWRLGVTGSTGAEGNWEGSGSMAWGLLGRHWELRGHGGYWEHRKHWAGRYEEATGSTGSTGAGRQLSPSTGGVLGGNWGRDTAQSHHWGVLGVLGQGDSPVPSLGVTGRALGHGHSPVPALEV